MGLTTRDDCDVHPHEANKGAKRWLSAGLQQIIASCWLDVITLKPEGTK